MNESCGCLYKAGSPPYPDKQKQIPTEHEQVREVAPRMICPKPHTIRKAFRYMGTPSEWEQHNIEWKRHHIKLLHWALVG